MIFGGKKDKMSKLTPLKKSLIIASLTIFTNFTAYFSFRWLGFGEVTFLETLAFTTYISIYEFIVIFIASYILFKVTEGK